MRWGRIFIHRLRSVLRRARTDAQLQQELALHLELLTKEYLASGLTEPEARLAARREFGSLELTKERCRDVRRVHLIEDLVRDSAHALRVLKKSPGFTLTAVLSLALGIGANTAIFSLLNSVRLAVLPVERPDQLVILSDPQSSGVMIGSERGDRSLLTYAEFQQLRNQTDIFSALLASESSLDRWQVRIAGGESEEVRGRLVSDDYFRVLGVSARLGRVFTEADDPGGAGAPLAVLSYPYWQRRFGGSPAVLGEVLRIHQALVTIVGVAPAGFFGETAGQQPDLWLPLAMQPAVLPGRDWLHDTGHGQEKICWLHVFGRLQPGLSLAQAEAKANAVFRAGLQEFYGSVQSAEARRQFLDQRLKVQASPGGASAFGKQLSDPLTVLLAAVSIVLLIACFNLANLLLARGAVRRREIALRLSLGAGRGRLVRQLLTESLVLTASGGTLGLAGAYIFHRGLVILISNAFETFHIGFGLDTRVLAFSFAVTLAATVAFGLLPAFLVTRIDTSANLKSQGRTTTGSAGQLRFGRALVAGQLALSLPLLVVAGLLARTFYNLQQVDLGYPRERLLVVRVDAQSAGYEKARRAPLFRELLEQIRSLPGVHAASFSENGLLTGRDSGDQIEVEGYTSRGTNDRGARWDQVGPGYFSALGTPLLLGREINESDQPGSPRVCVINEAFAHLFFAGRNPIGMHVTTVFGDQRTTHQIVGVAKDSRINRLRGNVEPRYYVPVTQPLGEFDGLMFEVRSAGTPDSIVAGIRQIIQRRDPGLVIVNTATVEKRLEDRLARERITAWLSVLFGLVALALGALGLYGVLSYGVAQRRSELGIRMALGAQPGRVIAMILGETTTLLVVGVVAGLALGVAAARAITSQLYGLAPSDPATLAVALLLLVTVGAAAAYVPARRASRLNPMEVLRQD